MRIVFDFDDTLCRRQAAGRRSGFGARSRFKFSSFCPLRNEPARVEIEPYEKKMPSNWGARFDWSVTCASKLYKLTCYFGDIAAREVHVILLGGKLYTEYLGPALERRGFIVSEPMAGLQIGERLRWLNQQEDT